MPGLLQVVPVRWFNAEADYALRQGAGLARRGWSVSLAAVPGSPIHGRAAAAGLEVVDLPDPSRNSPVALARCAGALRDAVRRRRVDAVNFHRSEGAALLSGALRGLTPRPAIVRTRGETRRIRRTPFNRLAWRRGFDAIVASGRAIAERLEADLDLESGSVGVIPYGIDTACFTPGGARDGTPVVGYVGRLGPVKGVAHLLDAAERLAREGVRFTLRIMVKDPAEYPAEHAAVERRTRSAPLAGRVLLEGPVADLPAAMRGLAVGVVPSVGSEANCRTAGEMMACGVPVVASRVGTLPEVVEDGVTGAIVEPGDGGTLAEALRRLLASPDDAARMGAAARRRIEEAYSLEGMIDATETLLLGLLGGRQ